LFNIVGQALQWDAQRRETERLAAGGNGSLQAAQLAQLLELCEQEQQWLACELHDGLAQEIQGALMYFQASEHLSGVNPDKARQAYEAGLRHLRRGVAETRSVIRRLQPAILEDHGLIAALAQLIAEKQSTADIEIEFSHEGQFEGLPRSVQHAAFRMVQEALTNACRYSQSPRIRVALIQHADRLHIQVTDWGVGFDPQAVRPQSFGLKSIRRRVAALGGHAEIHSAPGQGTEVTARLPLVGADRGSRGLAPGG
jgi:signal transduction histidine kinase